MAEDWNAQFARLLQATKDDPKNFRAWAILGNFYYAETENPELAVRALERAQELAPHRDLRHLIGRALVECGDADRGFAMLQASVREHPRPEAYCILCDTYLRGGQDADAEKAARAAVRLDPTYREAYYMLGRALRVRDWAAAIEAYRKALSLSDTYELAWQGLGSALLLTGNLEESVSASAKAVELDPDDVWARAYLANGLWGLGRLKEAEEQYLAAIAVAPDSPEPPIWYKEFLDWRAKGGASQPRLTG